MHTPASATSVLGTRKAGNGGKLTTMQWLLVAAGVQLLLFISFIGFFFTSESHRQGELTDMQSELHRLRTENTRQSKRLIHANQRMLKYEADIRAELAVGGGRDADLDEDDEEELGARADDDEEAAADAEAAEAEDDDAADAADEAAADMAAAAHADGGGHNHGSIAPAAHTQPAAAARLRHPDDKAAATADDHHGHPQRASMPSAASAAAAAAAMPPVLRGKCLQLEHEWWTYELCFGGKARQFHAGGTDADSYPIGSYVRPSSAAADGDATKQSYMLQRYRGGASCAVGEVARSTEVRLECSAVDTLDLASVIEPNTCHYLMTVHVPESDCWQVDGKGHTSSAQAAAAAAAETKLLNYAADALEHHVAKEDAEAESARRRTNALADAAAAAASSSASAASAASSSSEGGAGGTGARAPVMVDDSAVSAPERSLSELQALDVSGGVSNEAKRVAVIHAIRHAWRGYEKHAFGADEVRPLSGGKNDWIGLGLTILDSLDVLWLAGLKAEYQRAAAWVHTSLSLDKRPKVSFFETTIRCLGGLLSAHELSGDATFLTKATDLGERLGRAFTSPSGMPYTTISLSNGDHTVPSWLGGNVLLAEVGTVQMEFASLAQHSGRADLRAKSDKVFDLLDKRGPPVFNGGRLWPIHVRPSDGSSTGNVISWGAMGDSFYEYLLKCVSGADFHPHCISSSSSPPLLVSSSLRLCPRPLAPLLRSSQVLAPHRQAARAVQAYVSRGHERAHQAARADRPKRCGHAAAHPSGSSPRADALRSSHASRTCSAGSAYPSLAALLSARSDSPPPLLDPLVSKGLTYVAESKNGRIERKMDHLVCFVPGMLALGAQHIPEVHDEHMEVAAKLARTCYEMYAQQKTGLAPEFVRFNGNGMSVGAAHNLLRPEAIEALFYMWRFTKDVKYREWGWRMFLAFEKHCRVSGGGYVGIKNVNQEGGAKDDKMETFWLAESLKYFLLLFSDDSLLDLSTHVLNTEAHPLRVMEG